MEAEKYLIGKILNLEQIIFEITVRAVRRLAA
jgi:hypothetical protein